ncbi:hypothetical protein [Streptomyces scabiei]|uniref:hypothetical protein n=2 Tax=Streptomyces scabiei TaxID=1930 RepID=UPI0029B1DD6C|nr:hypothetical protein [Streptomyces scabiei]MDX2538828.1 hypothetical protein [Streptomyces scabiei]MDX2802624.1 hypothetical protein [Streptomyces scabiei]MDX3828986.1 hypothetical protein [Streptomyces scabiei]
MTRTALPETHADDHGCGCVPAPAEPDPNTTADIMQARAIASGLAEFGIGPARWSAAYDHQAAAVVLRVDTPRGLYALAIPAPGQPFPVRHRGERIGALDCRRTYGTADSYTAALFAAFLRDRAALDIPGQGACPTPQNMV